MSPLCDSISPSVSADNDSTSEVLLGGLSELLYAKLLGREWHAASTLYINI